jgi:hypothetical protein
MVANFVSVGVWIWVAGDRLWAIPSKVRLSRFQLMLFSILVYVKVGASFCVGERLCLMRKALLSFYVVQVTIYGSFQ